MDYYNNVTTPYFQEMAIREFIKIVLFFELDFYRIWCNANYYYYYNDTLTIQIYNLYKEFFYKTLQKTYIIEPSEISELQDETTVTIINTAANCITTKIYRLNDVVLINLLFLKEGSGNNTTIGYFKNIFKKVLVFWINSRVSLCVKKRRTFLKLKGKIN